MLKCMCVIQIGYVLCKILGIQTRVLYIYTHTHTNLETDICNINPVKLDDDDEKKKQQQLVMRFPFMQRWNVDNTLHYTPYGPYHTIPKAYHCAQHDRDAKRKEKTEMLNCDEEKKKDQHEEMGTQSTYTQWE